MKQKESTFILHSKHKQRAFSSDVRFLPDGNQKPIILFIHGFKGFKDFAFFNVLADHFCREGFVVVKMNLSHNGTTPEQPIDFVDLDAFGNNNYSIESDDIDVVLNHIESVNFAVPNVEIDLEKIYLMGHSRGGGISIIKASEDKRIKKLVTWASVSTMTSVMPVSSLEQWKEDGVYYVFNGRTKQDMPLYYQLVEDYFQNEARFNVQNCASQLEIPHLIVHGDQDETVKLSAAKDLISQSRYGQLEVILGGSHTLGGYHPYDKDNLPEHAQSAFEKTVEFLRK